VKLDLRVVFLSAIAIVSGIIVLLGYFIQMPFLVDLREMLLGWAVVLAGILLLVGIVNLARVHWHKVKSRDAGFVYSIVLLISLAVTLVILIVLGPTHDISQWIFNYIQVPIESSLMALLAVILVYAVARMFRGRFNLFALIFVGTLLLVILGTISFPGIDLPFLRDIRAWISQVLAVGGARGILLGVALGTIATGLRVLIGAERPYGG